MKQNTTRRVWMPLAFLMALICLVMVQAAPASAAAARKGTYSKRWTGIDRFTGKTIAKKNRAGYFVTINSITKKKIRFQVSSGGQYGDPIYETNIITAKIKKNRVTFKWRDSWLNRGKGVLKFCKNKNRIQIRMTVTKLAKWNRGSLETARRKGASKTGFLTLKRTSSNSSMDTSLQRMQQRD